LTPRRVYYMNSLMAFPQMNEVYDPQSNDRRAGVVRIQTPHEVWIDHAAELRGLYAACCVKLRSFDMEVLYLVPPKDDDDPGDLEARASQLAHRIRTESGIPSLFHAPKPFVRRGGRKPATNRKACELQLPTGEVVQHPSTSAAARALGVNQPTLLRWLSDQVPWPGGGEYRARYSRRHLNGLRGRYL